MEILQYGFMQRAFVVGLLLAVVTTITGLFLSYYVGVKPGGTIVLLEVLWFLVVVIAKRVFIR